MRNAIFLKKYILGFDIKFHKLLAYFLNISQKQQNPKTLMRDLISSILLVQTIILSFIHTITAKWILLADHSIPRPAHRYQIYCQINQSITGNVTWSGSSNLNVYVYTVQSVHRSGLYTYTEARFQSQEQGIQSLTMVCSKSDTFYFEVQPHSIKALYLTYNLSLFTANLPLMIKSSTFFKNSSLHAKQQAFIFSSPVTTGFAVKYQIPGNRTASQLFQISCFGTSFSSQYRLTTGKTMCLPAQHRSQRYILVITDGGWNPYYIQPSQKILLYYDPTIKCQNNDIAQDQQINQDQLITQDESRTEVLSKTSLQLPMIGIIVGCTIGFIFIIIVVAYCRWRLLNNRHNKQVKYDSRNVYVQQNSTTNVCLDHQVICSICLGPNCDERLFCGHIYHRKCIGQWTKINNYYCPLCKAVQNKFQIYQID